MNSFTLIGRLGTEPVARTSGESVLVRLSIGVNEKTNKAEKKTDWFDVILWNSLAIVAGKYFQTGTRFMSEAIWSHEHTKTAMACNTT